MGFIVVHSIYLLEKQTLPFLKNPDCNYGTNDKDMTGPSLIVLHQ